MFYQTLEANCASFNSFFCESNSAAWFSQTSTMLVTIYALMGIINILANNYNFNINPNRNPDMDIRVRREVNFKPSPVENTVQNVFNEVTSSKDQRTDQIQPYSEDVKVVSSVQSLQDGGDRRENLNVFPKELAEVKNIKNKRLKRSNHNNYGSIINNNYNTLYQRNITNNSYLHNGYNQSYHNNNGYYNQEYNLINNRSNAYPPFTTIKYNRGYYFLYPNNTNYISAYNFTNFNNKQGYYPYYQPNNTNKYNTNYSFNNQHYNGHINAYNSTNWRPNNAYNTTPINNFKYNNQNYQNNNDTNGYNTFHNGYNVTDNGFNITDIVTTTPKIKISCMLGCNMDCPALFRKIGIFCLPEDEIDE